MPLSNTLQVEYLPLEQIKDYSRVFRIPGKKQIEKTERMIRECGFILPVVIDGQSQVVIGGHLLAAARHMSMEEIPVIRAGHLSETQVRLLRIAHERIATEATWDQGLLAEEFRELILLVPDIDLTLTGFEVPELDIILDAVTGAGGDDIPAIDAGTGMVCAGDLWQLGDHRLYCGDATLPQSYTLLMAGKKARLCFTDAPYNVKIDGHVGNSGKIRHREFVMASGEMSADAFTQFLYQSHHLMATHAEDGAIIYSCMDWRHIMELSTAAALAHLDLQNLCVWVKDNGGMGSFYRSRHELVFVFKKGTAAHANNIQLGKHGRYRTNVWEYPGVNSFAGGRMQELALHPTVKPLALVADAIKDASARGEIVLDPFGGSGTTLIAAEKSGRKARLIELDPLYCEVIIRRWQEYAGKEAVLLQGEPRHG
jgi:DNA modification methylase